VVSGAVALSPAARFPVASFDARQEDRVVSRTGPVISGRRMALAVGMLSLVAIWAAAHVALVRYVVEDSYIHFRVAENLVTTGHPYFNAGAAVKTSSSTPWTWLLAVLFWISPRNLALVSVVTALISAAGAVSWLALLRSVIPRRLASWEVAIVVTTYMAVVQTASFAAMETGLALFFAGVGLTAYAKRESWAFALLAAAAVTRLELGALFLACACSTLLLRSFSWRPSLVYWTLLGGLPTSLYDLVQYRTLVPQAAVAKPIVHQLPWAGTFGQLLPEAIWSAFFYRGIVYVVYATACLVMATLPILRLEWSRRIAADRGAEIMLISSATALAVSCAYALAHGLIFPWYRPLYFSFFFLTGLIAAARSARITSYLGVSAVLLPLLYDLGGSLRAAGGHPEAIRYFLEGARARQTRAVAAELYRDYPDAVLMTSEIGAVGFEFHGTIEDCAGLASPEALSYYPLAVPTERYDSADAPVSLRFLKDRRPGLVVAVDRHLDAVLSDPIRADYVHVRRRLYEADDDARRLSEVLLWDNVRYLDVLIRADLWRARHPEFAGGS
jgi:hypothetical protein